MPVELVGVGHRFGSGPWLFRSVDARVEAGSVAAVVGPSGSGKSTLLAICAGWMPPAGGSARTSAPARPDRPPRIAWVFQNPHGAPHRTALDHVALPLLARGVPTRAADERARRLLEEFGLAGAADRPFSTLSGGEAQRLLMARALAGSPDVLLVDEPTAQLDQTTAHRVADALTALHTQGTAVVIATHDPAVRDQCDQVIDLGDERYRGGGR